jgi:cleavage and polyadenylation specificity factor subunit 1
VLKVLAVAVAVLMMFAELNMEEMISMEDEESGTELRVISANFADPYLLILREDSSLKLFKASDSGELEELEWPEPSSNKWLSASLYKPSSVSDVFAFLLAPDGGLQVRLCRRRLDISFADR